jgi:3',5'-cyclic AMP phosphodiesterase CpdA
VLFTNGNHDYRGLFNRHLEDIFMFRQPEERDSRHWDLGRNFAVRQGDIAMIGLDTGEDKPDRRDVFAGLFACEPYRRAQTAWLADALARPEVASAPYIVAFCHIPLFDPRTNENPGDVLPDDDDPRYKHPWAAWQRTCANMWGPLFAKAGVQLVCTGHQHRYRYDAPSAERPWTHIVGGQRDVIEGRVADGRLVVKVHDCENGRIVFDKEFE